MKKIKEMTKGELNEWWNHLVESDIDYDMIFEFFLIYNGIEGDSETWKLKEPYEKYW